MALDAILQRFVEECPVAVMARMTLERGLSAAWIDEVFDQHRQHHERPGLDRLKLEEQLAGDRDERHQ